jgi:DNA mismatch repair ATPase MutS
MAGKTTLLRAIGVNQILALMGGPVAADRMRTRPLLPWCAMRVRDSLASGVSYFLAELQRLKRVVDAARAGPALYLLDEVLQGTNSAERRIAARIVLGNLVRTVAVGAITTHDLRLAATPELERQAVDVHFREEVIERDGVRTLEFDYLLRPGPATSRNALLLLKMVGLETDE